MVVALWCFAGRTLENMIFVIFCGKRSRATLAGIFVPLGSVCWALFGTGEGPFLGLGMALVLCWLYFGENDGCY